MEYGWIDEFKVPEFLKLSYEYDNSKNVTVCMATLKSDPVLLYEHLKLLAQNWRVTTLFLPSEKSLIRWQEIDALNTQTKNWFYLNTPKSEKKEPLDHNKIIDLVETFLLMITRFYPECDLDQKKVEQQLKSGPKNKARIPYEGSDEQNFWFAVTELGRVVKKTIPIKVMILARVFLKMSSLK